ncbi:MULTISPECIES: hypothetical protein [unclassified Thioalkalivibrio]|uniref:hypothetical protein n=1 Tax=unclassified Thioalkalivibrio TaxID=2621013 RepID=UPI000366095C|nr:MULTISPECIES: hypothetical protein [unclassified Thioalkalivibrio]
MFARLSAWITARSVPGESSGRILVLAPRATLETAADWLQELAGSVGPIALGVTDCGQDREVEGLIDGLPALAMRPELAATRLARLQPRAILVIGPLHAGDLDLGPALGAVHVPRIWINAEGDGAAGVEWNAVFAAREAATPSGPVEVIGDPIAGAVELPPAPSGDDGFCERFREYHEKGHPILLAPNTGPGEEAFAFAVLFAVLRKSAAILLLAPADPARHEPVYRDAIKYSLPIIRHNRFMTSFVPRKNRVYYIEDPETLHAAYTCADVTLPGGTLAASETPPDLGLPLACGSAVICGPAQHERHPDAATRLRIAAEHTGLVARGEDPEQVAEEVLARLAEGIDRQARRERLAAWQARQAGAREAVQARLQGLLGTS